jgi:hypothetical protein
MTKKKTEEKVEEVVEEKAPATSSKKEYKALIEAYAEQNPEKYAGKKDALAKKLDSMK